MGPGGTAAFVDFLLDGEDGGGSLPTRGLCVVAGRTLTVHTPASGAIHEIALPDAAFAASSGGPRLWPLDVGVLIAFPPANGGGAGGASESNASGVGSVGGVGSGDAGSTRGGGPPALFTLTHPLDALRPVRLPGGASGSYFDATMHGFADTGFGGGRDGIGNKTGSGGGGERVVWIGREPRWPLAVVLTRFTSTSPETAFSSGSRGSSSSSRSAAPAANHNRLACWALRRERREGSDGDRYTHQKGGSSGWGGRPGGQAQPMSQGRRSGKAGLRDSRDTVVGLATESMVLDMKHESLLHSLGRSRQSLEHEASSTAFSRTGPMAATTTRGRANNATVRWGATLRAADTPRGPLVGNEDDEEVPLPPSAFRGSSRLDSKKSPVLFPGGASSAPISPFQPVPTGAAAAAAEGAGTGTERALLGTSPEVAHGNNEAYARGAHEPEASAESSLSVGGESPWAGGRGRGHSGSGSSSGSGDFTTTARLPPEPVWWGGHSPNARAHNRGGGGETPIGEKGIRFGDTGLGRFTGRSWNDDDDDEGGEKAAGGLLGDAGPEPQFTLELVWTEEGSHHAFDQTGGGQGDELGMKTTDSRRMIESSLPPHVGVGRVSPGLGGQFRSSSSSTFRGASEGRPNSPQSGGSLASRIWLPEQVLVAETPRGDRRERGHDGRTAEEFEAKGDDDGDENNAEDAEWSVASRPTLMLVDPSKGVLKAIGLAFHGHNNDDDEDGGIGGGLNGFAAGCFGRQGSRDLSSETELSSSGSLGCADSQEAELRVRSTYLLKSLPRNRSVSVSSEGRSSGEADTSGLRGKNTQKSSMLAARSAGVVDVSLAHSGLHVRPARGSENGSSLAASTNSSSGSNSSSSAPLERTKRLLLLLSAGGLDKGSAQNSGSSVASPPAAAELLLSDGGSFFTQCALQCSVRAVAAALSSAAPSSSSSSSFRGDGHSQSSTFVPSALLAGELDAAAAADNSGRCNAEGSQLAVVQEQQNASEGVCVLQPLRVLRSVGPYADVLCEVDESAWPKVHALFSSSVQRRVLGGSSARRLVARVRVSLCLASSVTADVLACLDSVLGRPDTSPAPSPSHFLSSHPRSCGAFPLNEGAGRGWCVRSQALQLRAAVIARADALARAIASSSSVESTASTADSRSSTEQPGNFKTFSPLEHELLATPGGSDCEWLALLQILAANFAALNGDGGAPSTDQGSAEEAHNSSSQNVVSSSSSGGSQDGAWAALLSSNYHRAYGASQLDVFLLPPLLTPPELAPNSTTSPPPATAASSLIGPAVASSAWHASHAKACLWALHLLYEDAKLDLSRAATTQASLGPLLEALSLRLGLPAYCHHYCRDRGAGDEASSCSSSHNEAAVAPAAAWKSKCTSLQALSAQGQDSKKKKQQQQQQQQPPSSSSTEDLPLEPPCVRNFLLAALARLSPAGHTSMRPVYSVAADDLLTSFPSLGDGYTCRTTQQVVSIFAALTGLSHDNDEDESDDNINGIGVGAASAMHEGGEAGEPSSADIRSSTFMQRCVACVEALCRVGFSSQQLSLLPLGVQLSIRQVIRACRLAPPPHWRAACYRIVGRDDLALLLGPHLRLGSGTANEGAVHHNGNNDDDDVAMDDGQGPSAWPSPAADAAFTLVSPIAHQHDLASPAAASSVPPSSQRRQRCSHGGNGTPASKGAPRESQLKSRGISESSTSGVSYDAMASFPLIPELSGFGSEEADGPGSSSGGRGSKWSSSLTGSGGGSNDDNDGLVALEAATEVGLDAMGRRPIFRNLP